MQIPAGLLYRDCLCLIVNKDADLQAFQTGMHCTVLLFGAPSVVDLHHLGLGLVQARQVRCLLDHESVVRRRPTEDKVETTFSQLSAVLVAKLINCVQYDCPAISVSQP